MASLENKALSHPSDQLFARYYSRFTNNELSEALDEINRLSNESPSGMSVSEQVFSGARKRLVQFEAGFILDEIQRRSS